MLDSFWGKFGQRANQSKTIIIKERKELFRTEKNSVQMRNEDVVLVNWEYFEEF